VPVPALREKTPHLDFTKEMSSPIFRSSQVTASNTPNRFTMSPGYRAFATGVKHAMLADNVLQTFRLYPNNNQMPPVGNQATRRGNRQER